MPRAPEVGSGSPFLSHFEASVGKLAGFGSQSDHAYVDLSDRKDYKFIKPNKYYDR